MFQHADAAAFLGQFLLPGIPEVIVSSELKSFQRHISGLELCVFCWKAKDSYRMLNRGKKAARQMGQLYQEAFSGLQENRQTVAV